MLHPVGQAAAVILLGNRSVKYPGWLTRQDEVRLVLSSKSLKIFDKKAQVTDYRILCLPLNAGQVYVLLFFFKLIR